MLILLLSCRFLEFMSFMFRTDPSFFVVKPELKLSSFFFEDWKVGFPFLGVESEARSRHLFLSLYDL